MGALEGVAGFPDGNGMREGWKGSGGLVAPPADDLDLGKVAYLILQRRFSSLQATFPLCPSHGHLSIACLPFPSWTVCGGGLFGPLLILPSNRQNPFKQKKKVGCCGLS